ncbi:two component transcriptional regulator, winged helix family [Actinobacteria bacterium OK074]|nr:two component transcriptional regulator, winged helix family [Actinobacteria bacterium OK074]
MPEHLATNALHRLLVVEDEASIRTLLESALRLTGYEVTSVDTGQSALLEIERFAPDLVLLDVMLPDLDGFEVTRIMRAVGNRTPVLFLTARTSDSVVGLRAGGDDYVTKPFDIEEVLLRIQAILRRTSGHEEPSDDGVGEHVLLFADLRLDERRHEVHRAGQYVPLAPTEFNLLAYLMANAGRVLSRAQIVDHVWHYDFAGDTRIIETYVKYLRKKIDRFDPPLIHTVRGIGYCLRLPRDYEETGDGRPASFGTADR